MKLSYDGIGDKKSIEDFSKENKLNISLSEIENLPKLVDTDLLVKLKETGEPVNSLLDAISLSDIASGVKNERIIESINKDIINSLNYSLSQLINTNLEIQAYTAHLVNSIQEMTSKKACDDANLSQANFIPKWKNDISDELENHNDLIKHINDFFIKKQVSFSNNSETSKPDPLVGDKGIRALPCPDWKTNLIGYWECIRDKR